MALTKERISLFEYRHRKAMAAANKAKCQQQVYEYLKELGYSHRWAEEAAEAGQDLREGGELNADELSKVNKLMQQIRAYDMEGYEIESSTTIY